MVGSAGGPIDLDPGPGVDLNPNEGNLDIVVAKYAANGSFLWGHTLGGPSYDRGKNLAVDNAGSVYIVGTYRDSIDLDPGLGVEQKMAIGASDFLVQKFDQNGNFEWGHSYGSISDDDGSEICADDSGNVYVCGYSRGNMDINPGGTPFMISALNGNADALTFKLAANGTLMWLDQVGSAGWEDLRDIHVDQNGSIYTVGSFSSLVDFDPTAGMDVINATGFSQSGYLRKISQCTSFTTNTISASACSSYTSPSGNHTWTSSGTYVDTLVNAIGCDSLWTVNLTITGQATFSTIVDTTCESYTSPSGNYVWTVTGVYHDTIPNSAGCDSIIQVELAVMNFPIVPIVQFSDTLVAGWDFLMYQWVDCDANQAIPGSTNQVFVPVTSGNYTVISSNGICVDTADCVNVIISAIEEGSLADQITIYPNPSQGDVMINASSPLQNAVITVFDLTGKEVQTEQISQLATHRLQLNHPAGVYFINIVTETEQAQFRLVLSSGPN